MRMDMVMCHTFNSIKDLLTGHDGDPWAEFYAFQFYKRSSKSPAG